MRPSVKKQSQDEGKQVDQRWGYVNARVVLVVGHAYSSSLDALRSFILRAPFSRFFRASKTRNSRPG